MATAQLMGSVTSRIQVGTWIANIYLRHPSVCARGAALIADATGGRFLLGLGVSHQPVNTALGIDMSTAPRELRRYVLDVRDWLAGRGPTTHLPQQPAPVPIPLYVATLGLHATERAAEIADGIMPTMWSPERVRQSLTVIARGRARTPDLGPLDFTLGLPVFVGEDVAAQRELARGNLALYTGFPYFQRMWREAVSRLRPTPWPRAPVRPRSATPCSVRSASSGRSHGPRAARGVSGCRCRAAHPQPTCRPRRRPGHHPRVRKVTPRPERILRP
jgi:alkanesulfonate monooxygenase SsuD/methylene tetrahydromethanopterin reductase-like flavin-dependent oxidoreductase (luciferase family)